MNQLCVNVSKISIQGFLPAKCKRLIEFQSRDPHIERMEKALNVWIEDQTEKNACEWTGGQERPLWIYSDVEWTGVREKPLQIYQRFYEAPRAEDSSS